ncbi:Transcriptional regulator, TetR family [Sulfitobacter noctilucicola]|uniref:TetR/AcrR family transcriptional repressor of nem operon n=1 Tax=Sulfitobacter noctilucicola TaxID=1342301 RepID=A0A7W6M4Z4_9RHOB|nr:TetR/AcrR family transcriptional regulator [Sulfitobacter noctilucicola]KIN63231.1 Transcriptional regulator, TetR family [Sulfitobacter noctilucicola]MBB4172242.1 TetR/AcrR family transcriptional repressor of nem operon [Sulfitobacter noctilucicola]
MSEQTKSDLKRQHILDTGRALVIKHGFGGVGIARLLSECNIPKGSFYYYFPSKDSFGQALLQDYVAEYLTRFDALVAGTGTAGTKLTTFWSAWLANTGTEGIATQCLVVKLGAEVADLSEDMRVILDDGVTRLVSRIADLLREGATDGSVRTFDDADATARMLYAKWLGAAILAKLSRTQIPLEQALVETVQRLAPHNT